MLGWLRVLSLSARRAWIEMMFWLFLPSWSLVALRKESVDRNIGPLIFSVQPRKSLSARRAWIEISYKVLLATLNASLSARRAWIEMSVVI